MEQNNKIIRIKRTSLRKTSQAFFLVLTFILTYLFYSRPMAICWLDPFWHLQAFFADFPNTGLNLYMSEGRNPTDIIHRISIPSFAYLGIFILMAFIFGRLFCGWICPFGTLLEYIENISPIKGKLKMPSELNDPDIKYIVLIAFLFLSFISSQTAFCEFCPAGTIFKGVTGYVIPLSIPIFICVLFIVFAYGRKTWCSYLCPLGAFFGIFSRFHILGIRTEKDKCVRCFMCNTVCPMDVLIVEKYINRDMKINDGECIKCMNCIDACPRNVLRFP